MQNKDDETRDSQTDQNTAKQDKTRPKTALGESHRNPVKRHKE